MFRDILNNITGGGVVIPQLAADLGISDDQLRERLRMMVHMGYLTSDGSCTPDKESSSCACCSGCRCSPMELPPRFLVTEKGRRLIRS